MVDTAVQELEELRERIAQLEAEATRLRDEGRRTGEIRFRLMADAAPVMLWMSGPDAACTFFNRRWLDFRGRSLDQESGEGWTEGVHRDDVQRCMNTYLTAFYARQDFSMEYRLLTVTGDYRWVIDTGVPRYEPDGAFAGYIGSAVDITDRRPQAVSAIPLTPREQQVLVLIADGKSTKEIAAVLGISYKTADSHRSRILEKLDVHETASMVRYAIRLGLVRP
jgi:PAS domain S-box-containing protein